SIPWPAACTLRAWCSFRPQLDPHTYLSSENSAKNPIENLMRMLIKKLVLLALLVFVGCSRGPVGGSGEIFGGGDIARQLLNRVRVSHLIPAVQALADGRTISCDLEALCADHSDVALCRSRPVLTPIQT